MLESLACLRINGMPDVDLPFDSDTWSTSLSMQWDSSFQSLKVFDGRMPVTGSLCRPILINFTLLPRLERLELASYYYRIRRPLITLEIIPKIVKVCPNLDSLHPFGYQLVLNG